MIAGRRIQPEDPPSIDDGNSKRDRARLASFRLDGRTSFYARMFLSLARGKRERRLSYDHCAMSLVSVRGRSRSWILVRM